MHAKAINWSIEIGAPSQEANYERYYKKIEPLLLHTRQLNITSKPNATHQGFELSFNYCRYLLNKKADLDVLFHLTCFDLDKNNLISRLEALERELGIKKILVVTGDGYKQLDKREQFANSDELLEAIMQTGGEKFETIAIGAYPGGNGRDSFDNLQECQRLRRKIYAGANSVYTQCLFDASEFEQFHCEMRSFFDQSIGICPSVALFENPCELERIRLLTRSARTDAAYKVVESGGRIRDYQLELCKKLHSICTRESRYQAIDLCPFGRFDLAAQILEELKA